VYIQLRSGTVVGMVLLQHRTIFALHRNGS
jgi:hypothetical protein